MLTDFNAIVIQIPFWVYLLFIFLLLRGIYAWKKHVVSLRGLATLPTIFLLLFLRKLMRLFLTDRITGFVMGTSFATSLCIGFFLINVDKVNVDKEHRLIELPGTWVTLFLSMMLFSLHFITAIIEKRGFLLNAYSHYTFALLKPLPIGIAVGRVVAILKKLVKGPFYVDLTSKQYKNI